MRLGWNGTGVVGRASIERVQRDIQERHAQGYSSYWLADHPSGGFDALTALAVAAAGAGHLGGMEIGTAVVPTFPRHPMVMAAQTLTAAQAHDGPFTLGVGLSHASMMAELGIEFARPIRHLREYLMILVPLLRQGEVDYQGELLSCKARIFERPMPRCSVLAAALGPQALKVAGELCDGTTLAWVGPRTVRDHIVPSIQRAAEDAGRDSTPRVLATLPVCVTDEIDSVRSTIDQSLSMYSKLPSYQAMFAREGVNGPGELAIVGSADQVRDEIELLKNAGVTDFCPNIYARGEAAAATATVLQSI